MEKAGRRSFLRLVMAGIIALFVLLWNRLIADHQELRKQKTQIIPFNKNKAVSFDGNYIVVNHDEQTTVFSAHCTHLGCLINKKEGDRLICPCHGSEYNLDGKVIKGPAWKGLVIIPFKITSDGNHIEIIG
ncbi:MAG TPA: ubiquinol-cytochrome c reductase iron-sulfur subunit [Bacteroidales bacterium]|nr:ubiquinol-cytochrome c reductase iron-sulfur subunit [Bacteroidales bacterium]